jgi:glyoxylase-like metal-dependent hydrolase (beta-lactamase superfamily II)
MQWSIWVLEYSRVEHYPVSGVIYGAHNVGTVPLPYAYVVMKGPGGVVMVDLGFDLHGQGRGALLATRYGVENWHAPDVVLGEIGLEPADVGCALLTHLHWDHAGNVAAFPNATVYVQERELSEWLHTLTLPRELSFFTEPIDPEDLIQINELLRDGRLRTVRGDLPGVLPGVDIHAAYDTHTPGSMWVSVRSGPGPHEHYVLPGDNVYVYENLEGVGGDGIMRPIGYAAGNHTTALRACHDMLALVGGDSSRILPVHERRIGDRHPTRRVEPGLVVTEVCLADGEPSRVG